MLSVDCIVAATTQDAARSQLFVFITLSPLYILVNTTPTSWFGLTGRGWRCRPLLYQQFSWDVGLWYAHSWWLGEVDRKVEWVSRSEQLCLTTLYL